ncbi:ribonuclease H-like domain-containing protein [Tanacetum coccineum]
MEVFSIVYNPLGGSIPDTVGHWKSLGELAFGDQSHDEVYGCLKGGSRNSGGKRLATFMVEEAWLSEKKEKLECFNCHNTGHFARECTAKGTHDGKKKRDSFYQHQEAGNQEKNQMCLLTMDDGIVKWGENTEDEETNHALMAISSSSEANEIYEKDEKLKKYKRIRMKAVKEMEQLQKTLDVGSIGTCSEHSVDPESKISRVPQKVYVSTPITTNEKGVFAPKSKEVEPSCVSHIKTPRQPIKDQATCWELLKMFVPADYVPADYVPAGHVLISADRYRIC